MCATDTSNTPFESSESQLCAAKILSTTESSLRGGKSQERNVSNQDFFFCEVLIKTLIQD